MDALTGVVKVGKIALVDGASSIDNAVTIRNVVSKYNLTERQAKIARNTGLGMAALFRVAALIFAIKAPALLIPVIGLAGLHIATAAVMLIGAGFLAALALEMGTEALRFLGMLKPKEKMEIAKEEVTKPQKQGFLSRFLKRHPLMAAIFHIGAQDFMQSLDNIAVVLIFAGGSLGLAVAGTLLSIGLLWGFLKLLDPKADTSKDNKVQKVLRKILRSKKFEAGLHATAAVLLGQATFNMITSGVGGLSASLLPILGAATPFAIAAVGILAVVAGWKAFQALGVLQEKANGSTRPAPKGAAPALATVKT